MLDYIAVDDADAVDCCRIVAPGEYAEMQKLTATMRVQRAMLPAMPKHPALLAQGDRRRVVSAEAAKATPAELAVALAAVLGFMDNAQLTPAPTPKS